LLAVSLLKVFTSLFSKSDRQSNARSVGRASQGAKPSFGAFLLLVFLLRLLHQKKSGKRFKISLCVERENPHLCVFPLSASPKFTLSWRFGRIRSISPVATGDRRSRRLRQAFEKA